MAGAKKKSAAKKGAKTGSTGSGRGKPSSVDSEESTVPCQVGKRTRFTARKRTRLPPLTKEEMSHARHVVSAETEPQNEEGEEEYVDIDTEEEEKEKTPPKKNVQLQSPHRDPKPSTSGKHVTVEEIDRGKLSRQDRVVYTPPRMDIRNRPQTPGSGRQYFKEVSTLQELCRLWEEHPYLYDATAPLYKDPTTKWATLARFEEELKIPGG